MSDEASRPADLDYRLDAVFDALSREPRRRVLGVLRDRPAETLSLHDLADYLDGGPPSSRGETGHSNSRQRSLSRFHHTHLPKLAAADLLEYDSQRETVRSTAHPAFRDEGIDAVIGNREHPDAGTLDALFEALANRHRRRILASLNHSFRQVPVETLARDVVAREQDVPESAVPGDRVEEFLVGFRHRHLPELSRAGLIEYDPDSEEAAYRGHPVVRVAWLHSLLSPDLRGQFTSNDAREEIGVIEGRENVVAYSQGLVERADEELFSMFTATDLLESGCFARVLAATRRGVDIFLGTCDPTVRDHIEENAPDAVLWEPESDWLRLPVEEDNVGRLLMVDREAVMIGTLGEPRSDGTFEEQALVGEGADNPLVMMVRQMLGPRLEQIDTHAADVDSPLPF